MVGERIREADFSDLCRMNRDPRVMATLGGPHSEAQTRSFLGTSLGHWERHGYGTWIFRDRVHRSFVGRAGLRHVEIDGNPEVELLYALMAEFWNRGLATEMARAIVKVAFARIRLGNIVAFTLPTNLGSRRVMEKAGFTYECDIAWAGLRHVLYRLENPAR